MKFSLSLTHKLILYKGYQLGLNSSELDSQRVELALQQSFSKTCVCYNLSTEYEAIYKDMYEESFSLGWKHASEMNPYGHVTKEQNDLIERELIDFINLKLEEVKQIIFPTSK